MTNVEIRTLKIQLLLTAGMFAACVAMAAAAVWQRGWFERFMGEKYGPLPTALRDVAADAARGQIDPKTWEGLSPADRLALYDDWMAAADSPQSAPKALLAVDRDLYLARVEQTLVCGRSEQRQKALDFAAWAASPDVIPVLERVQGWAKRQRLDDFDRKISATIERLTPLSSSR
jgi:hypothetical protein